MPEIPPTPAERAAEALQSRRDEVAQYNANRAMFETIAASLPSEWPEHLAHHKGAKDHQKAAANVDIADVPLLANLLMREHCEKMAKTELLEGTKAAAILAVLEANAPVV